MTIENNVEPAAQIETPADTSSAVTPSIETPSEQPNIEPSAAATSEVKVEAEPKSEIKPNFPEDWREKYAKGDEKKLNVLKRYASVEAALDAKFEADKKISSYKPQLELPKDPKPEDIANYRKAYNIPETPQGYDLKLDNGIIIGDEDKILVDKFLERAHARHAKPAEVKAAIQDHFENIQAENALINERLVEQRKAAEDEMRGEWGSNFRQNVNVVTNFLTNKFGDAAPSLMGAVLTDGTVLKDNPKILRALLAVANDIDPIATIGGSSNQTADSIQSEINAIELTMSQNPTAYYADKNLVKRYEELITTNEKLKSRK